MTVIQIAGKEVDLDKARPITVRDWRELKKLGVNVMTSFKEIDPESLITFATYLLRKANAEITEEHILDLPGPHLTRILELLSGDETIDVPF